MKSQGSLAATARRMLSSRSYAPSRSPQPWKQATLTSSRSFHVSRSLRSGGEASNPPMAFPCLDAMDTRSASLRTKTSPDPNSSSGPEPSYTSGATKVFHCKDPLQLDWGGILPSFDVAYETWGELNADKSNAILLHTGLSASSHAHSTEANPMPGWWEKFIGPGAPLDTDKYHIICTNVIGGCYGSTGPLSLIHI